MEKIELLITEITYQKWLELKRAIHVIKMGG